MSDNLVNRLRGVYEVGENAEFGTRSFADFIPPISIEAADKIEALESRIKELEPNPLSQFTRGELLEEIRRRMED